jgi:NAD binding domain of 6-phosphogluconate dehydrogenase
VKIGFAGLGNMGGRLASRLVGVGDLTVYDVYEPSREAFRDRAHVASSVAEVGAGADETDTARVRTGLRARPAEPGTPAGEGNSESAAYPGSGRSS